MRTIIFEILLSLLVGCGAEPKADQAAITKPNSNGGIQYAESAPKEVTVEYRKDGDKRELAVDNTSELPPCTHNTNGQSAWVKSTQQVLECLDETWIELVPPPGSNPDTATPSPTPSPKPPVTESLGKTWTDPVLGTAWMVGAAVPQATLDTFHPCVSPWRLGTRSEVRTAYLDGLGLYAAPLSGSNSIWTSDLDYQGDGTFGRYMIGPGGAEQISPLVQVAIACLKS